MELKEKQGHKVAGEKNVAKRRENNPPRRHRINKILGFSVPETEDESNFFQMPFTLHEGNVLLEYAKKVPFNEDYFAGYRNQARIYNITKGYH